MKKKIRENLSVISVTCLLASIVIYAFNLFGRIGSPILTTIGCILTAMGLTFLWYDKDNQPKRGFEFVKPLMRRSDYAHIPTRSSINSAGYDFYSDQDYTVSPNEIIKIWTNVKAYMCKDEFLMLDVRSSMGGKFMLANTIGIIDSDYYSNPDNDGNIGIFLKNISNETQYIKKDERIAQGIFIEFLKADDIVTTKRNGGFGSSNK